MFESMPSASPNSREKLPRKCCHSDIVNKHAPCPPRSLVLTRDNRVGTFLILGLLEACSLSAWSRWPILSAGHSTFTEHTGHYSGTWGIETDVRVSAYDGSWAQEHVLSQDVNF